MAKILSVKVRVDVNEITTTTDSRGREIRTFDNVFNQTFREDQEVGEFNFNEAHLEQMVSKAVPFLRDSLTEQVRVKEAKKAQKEQKAA